MDKNLALALKTLHDIGSAHYTRRVLAGRHVKHLTAPLKKSLQEKALSDAQIETLAFDVWEEITMRLAKAKASRRSRA